MAAFTHHVVNIVFLCSQKQMSWVYTQTIITLVTYTLTQWYCTIYQLPSYTVGWLAIKLFLSIKHAIATVESWTRPLDTTVIVYYLGSCPELFSCCHAGLPIYTLAILSSSR